MPVPDIWKLNNPILVTCPRGHPRFLRPELETLGFSVVREGPAMLETMGTLQDAMRLNLHCRTGHRVLYRVKAFPCADPAGLSRGLSGLPWEEWLDADGYFRVDTSVSHPSITDPRFATLKVKDAIVDRIRSRCGRRPNSGSDRSRAVVFIYWQDDRCSVYLDTTGESLSNRGYRGQSVQAPMRESLAAACVLATRWHGTAPFVNPMCGSGTLAIEAAIMRAGQPPGWLRTNFAFMHIKGYRSGDWETLREAARKAMVTSPDVRILASDRDPKAIAAARENARRAGVDHLIEFTVCDLARTEVPPPSDERGVLICNPPYGERLGEVRELEPLYRGIGDYFKQRGRGYTGYLFTANRELASKVGLQPKLKIPFYNGPLECRLLVYEIF